MRCIIDVDVVVLVIFVYVIVDLFEPLVFVVVAALWVILYVDVVIVILVYLCSAVRTFFDAIGFLVLFCEGRLLVGCMWLSTKWEYLVYGFGVLIRGMVGWAGDQCWMTLDDAVFV